MAKCMKCGGMKSTSKMGKMQKGGMKTTVANKNAKTFIAGMPNSGPTGPNYQGINTMQKGGVSGYMKAASNAAKKKVVDSSVKPTGPDRPSSKPMMAKAGGSTKSFPDLTGDGKVTKADVLKGRGVIKKKGGMTKAKFGASVSVQRSPKAGKVRSASAQGYSAVGKREPGRVIKKTLSKKK